ncbi:MAG: GatB/YqeY domain-containing protein [Chloroflexota bacterium]|nr:MAG: GatB/YqeY domain-containing protein [Chloroflexota bacterium]
MSLKEELEADVKTAMREGDVTRRDTLRMLLAAIKQVEKDDQVELDDEAVQKVVAKQAKQRKESIADAERAGRTDLVAQEEAELAIIEAYLPQMLSQDEIRAVATQVIDEQGASGMQDMGRVMGQLMPRLQGQADGKLTSQIVRELLQS